MAAFDTAGAGGEETPPPARHETSGTDEARTDKPAGRPPSYRRSTRGGSGSAAGATPKKSYRPTASSRPRPAGKKPDTGRD